MKILLSSSPWALPRSLPGVVGELLDRGVELVVASVEGKDPLPEAARHRPGTSVVALPTHRPGAEHHAAEIFRALCDLARFYDPELADAGWARLRTARRLLDHVGHPDSLDVAPRLAALELPPDVHARMSAALTAVERQLPPIPGLPETIAELDVDAVVLVSRCSLGGFERDLLKATARLGVPSIMLVWSWDNLSSKAALHEHPDYLLVWNDLQVDEAERLHGIARDRVHAIGAPTFDPFFDELASLGERPPRAGEPPTILYIGSSKNISRNEPEVFDRWLAAVRSAPDPLVRDARIVVRPYPGHGGWRFWKPESAEFTVERGRRLEPEGLARTLAEVDVVVALNTSAELEAAAAGVPVVTYRAGESAPGQEGSVHFEYLLEQRGGFVIDSRDLGEHVANLARVLGGDHDAAAQRDFVRRFLRPLGLEHPVSPLVAAKIMELVAP